ncbi:MAG TPA: endonuclease/exonuclease/phosphatase family protein [Gemmatimonas sp.]|nr:endonuclease/exonuclease/phosphatase family protein [Gemmatimonas sp.]
MAAVALATLLSACRTGRNYADDEVPRFAAAAPALADGDDKAMPDSLRLVTFNIKFADKIDEAIRVLTVDRALYQPDLLFLQEMDGPGTAKIAAALGMAYVYYPATHRRRGDRDFGNALLSQWPIVSDTRMVLPHHARTTGAQRSATVATVRIGHRLVRVYSVHLGTLAEISHSERRNQLERVIADAMSHPYVIIGGDMNSAGVGPIARQHGFTWLTAGIPRTSIIGRLDHFFVRGFDVLQQPPVGISRASRAASDHNAVWAILPMVSELPFRRPPS